MSQKQGLSRLGRALSEPLICLALVVVLQLLTNLFLPIHFETNDDACMALTSAGCGLNDSPNEHLLHMNIAVGWTMKLLNSSCPGFPWYTFWLLSVQCLSLSTLLYLFRKHFGSLSGLLAFSVYFCASAIGFCSRLQFTSVAITAATTGLVVLASWARAADESLARSRAKLVLSSALMILGSLTRADGFILAGILGASWFVFTYGWGIVTQARPRTSMGVLLVCTSISLILSQINGAYYRNSEEWKQFYDWNLQILKFHYGYIRYTQSSEPRFKQFGWSQDDLDMLFLGNVSDCKIFSLNSLRELTAVGTQQWRSPMSPRILLGDLFGTLRYPMCYAPLFLVLMAILLLPGGLARIRATLLFLLGLCLMSAILAFGHLPPRVYLSILASINVFTLFDSHAMFAKLSDKQKNSIFVVLSIICLTLVFPTLKSESDAYVKRCAELSSFLKELAPKENQLYVAWVTLFPFEALSPFDNWQRRLSGLKLVWLSQYAWTPFYQARLKEFRLSDLTCSANRNDVFWISNSELNSKFSAYALRHFDKKIIFDERYAKSGFNMYSARSE